MRIRLDPKQAGLAVHWHERLWPCVGEHKSGRALSEPRAVAAGDDVAHENRADHAAELQRLALGAPDADAGHESRRVLIFGGGHSFAGVNQHPLANRDLNRRRALAPVLDILASMDDGPSKGCRMAMARRSSLTRHAPSQLHHVVGVGAADEVRPASHDRPPAFDHRGSRILPSVTVIALSALIVLLFPANGLRDHAKLGDTRIPRS